MRICMLGSAGWYDTPLATTPCVYIESDEYNIFIDAGLGFAKADTVLNPDKPTLLLISHFHLDHVYGLHTLVKLRLKQPLTIAFHADFLPAFHQLVNPPFTVPVEHLPYPVELKSIDFGYNDHIIYNLEAKPLKHTGLCLGFRLELDGLVMAYCSDTSLCPTAVELAHDADLLIAECSNVPGTIDQGWGHMSPEEAARLAVEAKARRLVLTHFTSSNYPDRSAKEMAVEAARTVFGATTAAYDGMEIIL
jgi:ribonuclease BN (tRNA processing enzyme)